MFKLKNIHLQIENKNILSIDTLNISAKSKALILGPSGCGKTTLLHVMAGLRHLQDGIVSFNGVDTQNLKGSEVDTFRGQNFGFVFQNFHLLKHLTLEQNIRLAAFGAGVKTNNDRLNKLLKAFHLSDKIKQKASSLSHGEAQRAAIIRAVIHKPKVIFADEPTSSLDDENTAQVIRMLEEQADSTGAMLIVATHDKRIKNRFTTSINLKDGKIVK